MPVDKSKKRAPSRKKIALRYARRGYLVLPVHTIVGSKCSCGDAACSSPGKHPRTRHGIKDATASKSQIKAWFSRWSHANIGIAAGSASGILVLDIDPRNGGDETFKRLEVELGPLPETVTADTGGGGHHLFFTYPDFKVKKDNAGKRLGRGIDVLSDNSFLIAAPSLHFSGNRYRWQEGRSFNDLNPVPLPEPWLARLREDAETQPEADETPPNQARVVDEGGRNDHLTRIAGMLQRGGVAAEAITAALTAENAANCSPPLPLAEVKKIVANIAKYSSGALSGDAAEGLMRFVLQEDFQDGKHLIFSTDGRFWNYDGRLWQAIPDQWLSGKVLQAIVRNPNKKQPTASLLSQVMTLLRAKLAMKDDVLGFRDDPKPVINCSNGKVWIGDDGSLEMRAHRADSFLRHCLDVKYDENASCPQYDKALIEIFSKAENPKRMVRHWNELVGYIIQPSRDIATIVILLGDGDNGKTKLTTTVIRLLGSQLVHAQRVEDLDRNRFTLGSLFGKYMFVDDDVKAGARLPDGMLKTISEAKVVSGELKYQPSFNFVVRTVPVLLCNNIPSLADLSHGMLRRLMVIPFGRRFTEDEKDLDLFSRIWAQELPGVLNRALAGYKRLIGRGIKFKRPEAVMEATQRWIQQANPLPAFVESCCSRRPDGRYLVQDFYGAYSEWTQEMGYTLTQNRMSVSRNLTHLGFATKKTNKGEAILGLAPAGCSND